MVVPIGGHIPERGDAAFMKALTYMGFEPGEPMAGKQVDMVFVGSCTNSSYEDITRAASVARQALTNGLRAASEIGRGCVKTLR